MLLMLRPDNRDDAVDAIRSGHDNSAYIAAWRAQHPRLSTLEHRGDFSTGCLCD